VAEDRVPEVLAQFFAGQLSADRTLPEQLRVSGKVEPGIQRVVVDDLLLEEADELLGDAPVELEVDGGRRRGSKMTCDDSTRPRMALRY